MKKKYLYTALGLMGIMGTLSIGVVDATIQEHPENVIPYTLNENEDFTAGTITVTNCNGTNLSTCTTITILDRYLGAREAGIGCTDPNYTYNNPCAGGDDRYGYFFQRGNNHGFPSIGDITIVSEKAAWRTEYANRGYYGSEFIATDGYIVDYREDSSNSSTGHYNLWGGNLEEGYDFRRLSKQEAEQRRGPCPRDFHVPSAGEITKLAELLGDISWKENLKLPVAGGRAFNGSVSTNIRGRQARIWTSTPHSYNTPYYQSAMFSFSVKSTNGALTDMERANAYSILCFYDDYAEYVEPPQSTCNAGEYLKAGATDCTQCPAGSFCEGGIYYQDANQDQGIISCTTLGSNYEHSAAGSSENTACYIEVEAGKYLGTANGSEVTTCAAGTYKGAHNVNYGETSSCEPCTAGNYCEAGSIAPTECPSGYTSAGGASEQAACYIVLTATFNENGATSLSSTSETCNLNYGSLTCNITSPAITPVDGFDVVGFNTDANATTGTTPTSISADITYYAITKSSSPIQITFDINGNGGASSTGECYRYNGSGSCSVTSPDITPAAGFTVIGWNADSATHTSQWNTGTVETVSSSTTYYAQSEKAGYQVTASYTVGTGVSAYSNTPDTCDVQKVYNGASYTACNITLPTLTLRLGYNTGVWSTGTQIENPGAVISLLADETYTASATPNDDTQYLVHYYQQNLSGAYDLFETYTGAGTTDTIATAVEKTYSGFAFSGTNTNNKLTGNIDGNGSLELKLYYDRGEYKLSFVVDGNVIQSGTVAYAAAITAPADPTKDCNAFAGWSSSVAGVTTAGTMPDSDVTFTANWNYTCSRSSGGGGGGRTTSPIDVVNETLDNNVQNTTDEKENGENVDNVDNAEGNKSGETVYSDEFKEAYEFAHSQGITTMPTIQQADMESPLTRIAMAKMLSYYAINVLGQKPDTSKTIKFKDVSNKLNTQYDNGVILAYQLGIMGINMPKNRFRPNDPVTRGEFGTALSRMLYKIADGKKNYYSTHLAKLMEEKIITNDNPNMKELRGYVMIMLKRSAENK